jgi:hypothetical protein
VTIQKHTTAVLLGLLFAGGTIFAAGPATASVSAGQSTVIASSTPTNAISRAPENRPRCHWVRGHYRWDYRRGRRVWRRAHRVCR